MDIANTFDLDEPRPVAPVIGPVTRQQRENGSRLVLIHDAYRRQVVAVRDARDRVARGADPVELARSVDEMTMRADYERFGSFCAQYCALIATHHSIEDSAMFPALLSADSRLCPVVDRLRREYVVIYDLLVALSQAAACL